MQKVLLVSSSKTLDFFLNCARSQNLTDKGWVILYLGGIILVKENFWSKRLSKPFFTWRLESFEIFRVLGRISKSQFSWMKNWSKDLDRHCFRITGLNSGKYFCGCRRRLRNQRSMSVYKIKNFACERDFRKIYLEPLNLS